jgi:cell division protein FtsA
MFELIDGHLKKIGRDQLLPAGIVITGGGAGLSDIKSVAEDELGLPARIGEIHFGSDDKGQQSKNPKDNRWAVACGLAIFGFNAEDEQHTLGHKSIDKLREGGRKGVRTLSDWISRFLP